MRKPLLLFASVTAMMLASCGGASSATTAPTSTPASSTSSPTPELCRLTFNPNGGTIERTTMDVQKGETAILPVPTKEGKEFRGWHTGFGGNDAHVDLLTPITKDMTLIAEWNEYDVTFLDDKDQPFLFTSALPGETAPFPDEEPVKSPSDTEYYHFAGWDFDFSTRLHSDVSIKPTYMKEAGKTVTIDWESTYYEGPLAMKFMMRDSLFETTDYSKGLAELSFGASLATGFKDRTTAFLQAIGFDNIVFSDDYETIKPHSIGYVFAHYKLGEEDVIATLVRGFDYGQEWVDNMTVGKSGDHQGFYNSEKNVKTALEQYVATNYPEANKRYWFTGYSRGGAVANLLAQDLLKEEPTAYTKDNLVAYTFEAPRGVDESQAVAWPNVYNLVNSADIVAKLLPDAYGLKRAGVDIDIYNPAIDELLSAAKEGFSIGAFVPNLPTFGTEEEFANWMLNRLLDYGKDDYTKYVITGEKEDSVDAALCNRPLLVDNYQNALVTLVGLAFGIKESTRDAILADIKAKYEESPFNILMIIASGQSLHDYLKPFLDEDGISYDDDALLAACNKVPAFLMGPGGFALALVASAEGQGMLRRMIAHHFAEVNYVLIKALPEE